MKNYLLACIFSIVFLAVQAQKTELPSVAPINPAYLEEISQATDLSSGIYNLPWHPGFSALSENRQIQSRFTLPPVYDMRTAGPGGTSLVTPVKNQSSCGSCWAFSSLAAVESSWMLQGYGEYDLSENNIKNCHEFLPAPCAYGANFQPTAMFARAESPVLEADDPYSVTNGTCLTGLTPAAFIPKAVYVPRNVEAVKEAIYRYGGVSMPIRYSGDYMNWDDYTHFNGLTTTTNHLVALVGWDDNKKVTGGPYSNYPEPGVFIAKNSYGTGHADNGFFYISYYDIHVVDWGVCWPEREDFIPGMQAYTHSRLGSFYSMGYSDPVGYGLVKFNIDAKSQLVRLGTYISSAMAEITFEVYDDFDDVNLILSNKITEIKNQYCHWPGVYSFELPVSESFTASNDIYIKVKYYTPGNPNPIPIETYMAGYCDPVIESNMCWVSGDGLDGNWYLIGGTNPSYLHDLCIYAYTESLSTWEGDENTQWANAGNWNNGVPDSSMHALIPNAPLMPTISGTERCRSVAVDNAMTLSIGAAASLQVDKQLMLYGSLSNSGSLISGTDASIIYRGSAAQTIDPGINSARRLVIDNPAGVTLNSSILIKDALYMSQGSITAGIYSISYVDGAKLVYDGSATQTTSSADFPSTSGPSILLIDNSAGVNLHANRNLDSTLYLISGVLNNSTNNLTLSDEQKIVRYDGSLSASPVFGTTINLDYRGDNAVSTGFEVPLSSTVLQSLDVNCPQTITLGSSATVNAILNLNIGNFNISAATLSIGDGTTINIRTGTLSGTPSFGSGVNLSYLGEIHYESGTEIPAGSSVLQTLLIQNTGGVDLNSNATVNNALILVSGDLDNSSSTLSIANNASIEKRPGLLDGDYGTIGELTAKPSFSTNVNLVYAGRWSVSTGYEMPDSSDFALNHFNMNNYTSLYVSKNLYAKGDVDIRGRLRIADHTITGPGNLNVRRAAAIHTDHVNGINNSSGVFQLGGTSTYNDTIDFYFEGSNPQFVGADIPSIMRHFVTYNSSVGGVTLQNKDIRIMGHLRVENNSIFNVSAGRQVDVD